MIEQEVIDNLLKSTDIVSVISSYIHVIKKGRSYVALCPFHDDKHPSLNISKEKQIYKCFSCGEGGNAITFVQHYEKISFDDAVRKLADLVGFHDPRLTKSVSIQRKDPALEALYSCINDLQAYYSYSLGTAEASEARQYLAKRGIAEEDIEKYGIGYSPVDGKKTIQFLLAKNHSLKSIEDIGITLARASGSRDSNAGRLIFPLSDQNGQVIGFSARRIVDDDTSKYINSPETPIFHKGTLLYNYHNAKRFARHDGYVYVLEGFMDTIALGKAGLNSAIALMGTNLTKEQIELLRRLNCEVRLCLDGDDPGQIGMMKAIKPLQRAGISFRLVLNSLDKRDPDDIYQESGKEALLKAMNSLVDPFRFQLSYYLNVKALVSAEDKKKALDYFLPFLKTVNDPIDREDYINQLSKATGYLPETIRGLLRKSETKKEDSIASDRFARHRSNLTEAEANHSRLYNAEYQMLYYLLTSKEASDFYEENIGYLSNPLLNKCANIVLDVEPMENRGVANLISRAQNSMAEDEDAQKLIKTFESLAGEKSFPSPSLSILQELKNTIDEERERRKEKEEIEAKKIDAGIDENKFMDMLNDFLKEKKKDFQKNTDKNN